ncbi:MAG: DUF554 family protein, partial [Mailhella sp.]|nr:DUF554 family protein [Mailhella sp.]
MVNTISILCGSFIGAAVRRGISDKYQSALFDAMGFSAFALGVNAVVANRPNSRYPVL